MTSPAGPLLPLELVEARRVGGLAASELDAVLADLEAWVNLDTPSYDVAALDAFAEILAETLDRDLDHKDPKDPVITCQATPAECLARAQDGQLQAPWPMSGPSAGPRSARRAWRTFFELQVVA